MADWVVLVQDGQVVELAFQLGLLGHEAFEFLVQEALLAFGRGQFPLGIFDLGGQIGDGGAEINGPLVKRLILRLQIGDLDVAFGEFGRDPCHIAELGRADGREVLGM